MTPVRIRGITYNSITAAARALAVDPWTVHKHLDAGTPDMIGINTRTPPRKCVIGGTDYPSLSAAATALGVSVEAIRQRANRVRRKASVT